MIKLLTVDDAEPYTRHLIRMKSTKGIRNISTEEIEKFEYKVDEVRSTLGESDKLIWGNFNEMGEMEHSLFCVLFPNQPAALFHNFKSETTSAYNPFRGILKLISAATVRLEELGIFRIFAVRERKLFNESRYPNLEDLHPLNRYNSYFEEIIPPNTLSKWELHNKLMGNRTFPVELVVICMVLKQQYRRYDGQILFPLTESKTN
jgi:hypothetical protein